MKISLNNLGIRFEIGETGTRPPVSPAMQIDQQNPKGRYVYCHKDEQNHVFYVGVGVGNRAWSKDRHDLWHRYVKYHLKGKYKVCILADNLSQDAAEEMEAELIAYYRDKLVNWVNMGRSTDFAALERYHSLRDANRELIQRAKAIEKSDLQEAVKIYLKVIDAISLYAFMRFEHGLVGQLLEEEAEEFGRNGELEVIDRLTLCLIKLGRTKEAEDLTNKYFAKYRRDLFLKSSKRVLRRVEKAIARL
jgi:hypothetical protein